VVSGPRGDTRLEGDRLRGAEGDRHGIYSVPKSKNPKSSRAGIELMGSFYGT